MVFIFAPVFHVTLRKPSSKRNLPSPPTFYDFLGYAKELVNT